MLKLIIKECLNLAATHCYVRTENSHSKTEIIPHQVLKYDSEIVIKESRMRRTLTPLFRPDPAELLVS